VSEIVWVLKITLLGFYSMPVGVSIAFDTEQQCEAARKNVMSSRQAHPPVCDPQRKEKQ
jgi:hypothetical protein